MSGGEGSDVAQATGSWQHVATSVGRESEKTYAGRCEVGETEQEQICF